ncbi:PilN domain-containing protein [Inquilinus limosus]|uniref:Fimbrial assembly protein n=1 Tax=Inquilinus limosus TaxID=171674 RepID=A0A211YT60_9PROT|nr:PilN domain-containing protein [Inquilinus limosus]OWJ56121.1 hypothetical protein BWR60_35350 [Inquilinus limosus]
MIAGMIRRAAVFLRWWGRELAGLVPDRWLFRPVLRRRRLILLWRDDGARLVESRGRKVLRNVPLGHVPATTLNRRGAEVVLRFPAEAGLRRRIVLPREAEASLGRVLRFEIDRLTPWPPGTVAFGARRLPPTGDAATMAVELTAMPREQVDVAVQAAGAAGWAPDVVDLAGEDPLAPPGPDLRRDIDAERRRALRRLGWIGGLGLGAPAVLAAAWLVWTVAAHWSVVSGLRDQVAAARAQTASASALQAEIRALEEAGSYLGAQRRAIPYVSKLIETVSQTLPDGAWLTELSLEQGTLRLGGFADDSAGLIPVLSALPQFQSVAFAAPSVRDPQRSQDRFAISAALVAGGPSP